MPNLNNYWIYLVIIAQFISAAVVLIDKYLVGSKTDSHGSAPAGGPAVYTFYVSILSGVVLVILPFGWVLLPTLSVILISLAVAFSYIFSILFLYNSLKTSDASDVAPVMGAISALSTLFFSFIILKNSLPHNFMIGFLYLIAGTFLMSHFRFDKKSSIYVILAGLLFGLSSVFTKMIFNQTTFVNGFFWSRMANVLAAVTLLLWPANLKAIVQNLKYSTKETKFLVIGNKALAGLAFLLILGAIKLGEVSVVNALGGIQFVFLLLLAFIFTYKMPEHFHEAVHRERNLIKKITASSLIIIGLYLLFI